jgi:Holliday junction resolvase-like predicted endonuclease
VLRGRRCVKAEIDLIGYKNGEIHIYEVKCSYRVYKARRQLEHIRQLLHLRNASLLFYCGIADQVHRVAA